MPYLPPEGFLPYPGSPLYYRSENGSDPQTGAPCRWVTYFDPATGVYHQVPYPLARQPAPAPEPTPPEPIPEPRPVQPPVPQAAPTPQPAPAPQSKRTPPAPPPARKKRRVGLLLCLLVPALLLAGGLTLWLTGAYTKLPLFQDKDIRLTHYTGKAPQSASGVTSKPSSTPEPTPEPSPEPTPEPTSEPTTEPTPEPTSEPNPEPVPAKSVLPPGEYSFDNPHVGQAVILTLYDDKTFFLETVLGGDVYYAVGTYQVEEGQLQLAPEGDYYREIMGDLSVGLFLITDDGDLTLLSPGSVGLMEAGESLTLTFAFATPV